MKLMSSNDIEARYQVKRWRRRELQASSTHTFKISTESDSYLNIQPFLVSNRSKDNCVAIYACLWRCGDLLLTCWLARSTDLQMIHWCVFVSSRPFRSLVSPLRCRFAHIQSMSGCFLFLFMESNNASFLFSTGGFLERFVSLISLFMFVSSDLSVDRKSVV